jgi:hypothetical protein
MDRVRELERIANKEHRRIVAHQVPVALFGVVLHRKSAGIALGVCRALLSTDGREAQEHRSLFAHLLKQLRRGVLRHVRVGHGKSTVGARTFGMDDALRNTLAVEVRHLLKQQEVLKHDRPAIADCKGVLVIAYRTACVRRHYFALRLFCHVILQDRESYGLVVRDGDRTCPRVGKWNPEEVANEVMDTGSLRRTPPGAGSRSGNFPLFSRLIP